MSARVFALGSELPGFLSGQMPRLFPELPGGSLWYVATDEALMARFAFLRSQLALRLTPDVRMDPVEFEGLRLLGAHSLTQITDFGRLFQLPALVFSPAVTTLVMSCPPHALVLFHGSDAELRRKAEDSFKRYFCRECLTARSSGPTRRSFPACRQQNRRACCRGGSIACTCSIATAQTRPASPTPSVATTRRRRPRGT